jgi:hypothetical protein
MYLPEEGVNMSRRFLTAVSMLLILYSAGVFLRAAPQDTGAGKLAKAEAKLEKALGTDTNWKPNVFKNLRYNMPCDQVKKIFPELECNTFKKYDFPTVEGKLFGAVKAYQFTFKFGKLQSATIIFGARVFDARRFATALLNVAQRKWGELPPDALKKKYKFWNNADHDSVSLTYYKTNWQLKVSMPRRDTGDVLAGRLSEATIRVALARLLGGNTQWVAPSMAKFKSGMYCAQVQQVYKTMTGCDPVKNWSWGTVTIKDHPLVHALKFAFNKGKLSSVSFIFHRQLDKELFKMVSVQMFEKKWGPISLEKRDKDTLTIYKSGYGMTQRSYLIDHWEIKHDFPKN